MIIYTAYRNFVVNYNFFLIIETLNGAERAGSLFKSNQNRRSGRSFCTDFISYLLVCFVVAEFKCSGITTEKLFICGNSTSETQSAFADWL